MYIGLLQCGTYRGRVCYYRRVIGDIQVLCSLGLVYLCIVTKSECFTPKKEAVLSSEMLVTINKWTLRTVSGDVILRLVGRVLLNTILNRGQ